MAYAKNKKTKNNTKASKHVHATRTTIKKSQRARSKNFDNKVFLNARKAILSVIVLASLAVILVTIFAFIATPENVIKSKIESIVADYYENFYYENLASFVTDDLSIEKIMEPYSTHGFDRTDLEQLLLFDDQRHASAASILTSYCNKTGTYVTIYPDPPFGRTDYHVDYTYSCNF